MKMLGKKPIKFFLIVLAAFLFFGFWGSLGYAKFRDWKFMRDIRKEAAKFEKIKEDREKAIANDNYGGKTPQETLDLFITALEKGDYELASKYFVVERQEEWKNNIQEIIGDNKLKTFLDPLKQARGNKGEYSEDKKIFYINKPINIDLVLYPNNNWKIDEI